MLVCNVSLRPPRRAIAADLTEAATAADDAGTGNIVFAALVDDPASVADTLDAYLGEIMLEAASASDAIAVINIYDTDIVEAVTAIDVPDSTVPPSTTTWNPSDLSGITLSGGDLTATSSSGGAAGVRAITGRTSGKYYFELTATTFSLGYLGLMNATASLTTGNTLGGVAANAGRLIYVNNVSTSISINTSSSTIGIAVDLTNSLIWFRDGASGSWNAISGTANNPATGAGGISFSTVAVSAMRPAFLSVFTSGQVVTANFGATSFLGAVPSGFTSGW